MPAAAEPKAPAAAPSVSPVPEETPVSKIPPQNEVQRIKIIIGESKEIPVAPEAVSAVIVSPEIAAAVLKNSRLTISALKIGETILILSAGPKRLTYIIQVTGKPTISERLNAVEEKAAVSRTARLSGSLNVQYSAGFGGNPSLLLQNLEFTRKLSNDKTLRYSGEMFKFFGADGANLALAKVQNFGINRMSLGIDSPNKSIDVLDSQINVSPVSFNNFVMRGFHLVKKAGKTMKDGQTENGLEIFAGFGRQSVTLFDNDQGRLAGFMMPVVQNETVSLRAGAVIISPRQSNRLGRGGTVFQVEGALTPTRNLRLEAEAEFANGDLSWRARLDFKRPTYGAFGEIMRLDQNSPFVGLGAQPGGRQTEIFGFFWRPNNRFGASVNYNHSEITRFANSRLAGFDRSAFFANVNFKVNRTSRLNFRYSEQQIETAVPGSLLNFQIETRTATIGHSLRFNRNLSNNFEARLIFSREAQADTELENGFNLNEQLRFSWKRSALTGFVSYTDKTPSLASLIVRNPQLLPPLLQQAFALNPARFLQIYRDRTISLLNGVELPLTRNLDTGIYYQTSLSRFTFNGQVRYNRGEILAEKQNNFYASLSVNMRLDAANSLQISGWKSFSASNQSAVTFSYTHLFGTESGGGFQFSKLLGFNRGQIQGRVYYDLNGNGQDDPGEPGAAGMTVQLDENRSVKTDLNGRYVFKISEGFYNIALISEELGRSLRASTSTRQKIYVSGGKTFNMDFGVSNSGFIAGRVFNDLGTNPSAPQSNPPGIKNVRVVVRPVNSNSAGNVFSVLTDAAGSYEFRNLPPGDYRLELDTATFPENFQIPQQTSRTINVQSLRGFYFDIPLTAQRAVVGVVFIDEDGDGQFNSQIDRPLAGVKIITSGGVTAVSDTNGEYILRNLPFGKVNLTARSPEGTKDVSVSLEFGPEPVTRRAVNFVFKP